MAIEYAQAEESPMEETPEEGSETTSIPASILGGKSVSPGDVIRLEVVKSDEDGTVTVKYASGEEDEPMGGIAGAAAKFEE